MSNPMGIKANDKHAFEGKKCMKCGATLKDGKCPECGTVAVGVTNDEVWKPSGGATTGGIEKKCPSCGNPMGDDTTKCQECGWEEGKFTVEGKGFDKKVETTNAEEKCPECGAEMKDGKCTKCGYTENAWSDEARAASAAARAASAKANKSNKSEDHAAAETAHLKAAEEYRKDKPIVARGNGAQATSQASQRFAKAVARHDAKIAHHTEQAKLHSGAADDLKGNAEKKSIWRKVGEYLGVLNKDEGGQPSDKIDSDKACQILHDGEANGQPLSDDQRKMFGAACGESSKKNQLVEIPGITKNAWSEEARAAAAEARKANHEEQMRFHDKRTENKRTLNSVLLLEATMPLTKEQREAGINGLVTNCGFCSDDESRQNYGKFLTGLSDEALVATVNQYNASKRNELVANAAKDGIDVGNGKVARYDADAGKFLINDGDGDFDDDEGTTPEEDASERHIDDINKGKKKGASERSSGSHAGKMNEQQALNEWLKGAPEIAKTAVRNAIKLNEQAKDVLLDRLVVNVAKDQKESKRKFLANKSLDELRELASLLPQSREQSVPDSLAFLVNGFGSGAPVQQQVANDVDTLDIPTINFRDWNDEDQKRSKSA